MVLNYLRKYFRSRKAPEEEYVPTEFLVPKVIEEEPKKFITLEDFFEGVEASHKAGEAYCIFVKTDFFRGILDITDPDDMLVFNMVIDAADKLLAAENTNK